MKTATIDASKTTARSAEASGSPTPDWTTNTPAAAGAEYVLCIDPAESGGPWLQEVQMTREEFIELKQRLAEIRKERPTPAQSQAARSFGSSPSAMFSRFMSARDEADRQFMIGLLKTCTLEEQQSAANLAFAAASNANALTRWLPPADQAAEEYPLLRELYSMLAATGWLQDFLTALVQFHEAGGLRTPESLFHVVNSAFEEFSIKVEGAAAILADHPETVREQIREAIKKHPELIA